MTGIHGRKIKKRKIERKNIVADGKEKEMYSKMKNHHDSRLEQKEARLKIAAKTGGQFNEIDVFGPPKSAQLPGIGCSSSSATMNQMDRIKANSRFHVWHWDETDKSHEVSRDDQDHHHLASFILESLLTISISSHHSQIIAILNTVAG